MNDERYYIYIIKNSKGEVVMIDSSIHETGEMCDYMKTDIEEYCDDEYGYYFEPDKLFKSNDEIYKLECRTVLEQTQEGNDYDEYVISIELVGNIKYRV